MNTATKLRLLKAHGFEPCSHPDCYLLHSECASNRIFGKALRLLNAALRERNREAKADPARSPQQEGETCEHAFAPHSPTYPHVLVCQRCRKAECASCGSELSDIFDTRPQPETKVPPQS